MENTENTKIKNSVLGDILFRLRENLILILIIVILAGALGVGYYNVKKPVYTAKETVNYIANYDNIKDMQNVSSALNLMGVYVDTMVDFCTSGVVLDRAEYYYSEYLKSRAKIDNFIEEIKEGKYNDAYDPSAITSRQYFDASMVSASLITYGDESIKSFLIELKVSHENPKTAVRMMRIFAAAIDQEGRDYFEGVKTYVYELVKDTDGVACGKEGSLIKTLGLFILIGIVLAILIIYLKSLMDNTVRDKDEFEKLTGINVLAYIEKQESYNAGK